MTVSPIIDISKPEIPPRCTNTSTVCEPLNAAATQMETPYRSGRDSVEWSFQVCTMNHENVRIALPHTGASDIK